MYRRDVVACGKKSANHGGTSEGGRGGGGGGGGQVVVKADNVYQDRAYPGGQA